MQPFVAYAADVFSAKGAIKFGAWGDAPGCILSASAESATHIRPQNSFGDDTRLQRLCWRNNPSPGALPQAAKEIAPLALNRYVAKKVREAPRIVCVTLKSCAWPLVDV